MLTAKTNEELKPLIDLCKKGRLFEIQEWIASGKPVNPPPPPYKWDRRKNPLSVAMELGFHSLVQVLIESGLALDDPRYSPLQHALLNHRLDLVKLLLEHGADFRSVNMTDVFDTWDPEIMAYFIEKGADVETGNPLAWALINRIRTTLGIFKKYRDRFPSFQEQANLALRHHCKEGDIKWVSLLLWAGADLYARGPESSDEEPDPEEDLNALEWAALCGHTDVFKLKKVRVDPKQADCRKLLREVCFSGKSDLLKELLEKGFDPNGAEDGGSGLIQSLLGGMGWAFDFDVFSARPKKNIDNGRCREKIKMIHMLARHGARWVPDRSQINDARRSLLRMAPDYTVEFLWIMSKYDACRREDMEELLRSPAMKTLISGHRPRVDQLMKGFVLILE